MQIITLQVDRRMLMAFGLLLLLWAILTMVAEKKRKAMCVAIMQRQDDLENAVLKTAAMSVIAMDAATSKKPAAQPKKTATRRK